MICIFVLRVGEAGSSDAEALSEPPLVGGEELLPGQPTENIALKRGNALPNLPHNLLTIQTQRCLSQSSDGKVPSTSDVFWRLLDM
jgi:hypothetical protein